MTYFCDFEVDVFVCDMYMQSFSGATWFWAISSSSLKDDWGQKICPCLNFVFESKPIKFYTEKKMHPLQYFEESNFRTYSRISFDQILKIFKYLATKTLQEWNFTSLGKRKNLTWEVCTLFNVLKIVESLAKNFGCTNFEVTILQ